MGWFGGTTTGLWRGGGTKTISWGANQRRVDHVVDFLFPSFFPKEITRKVKDSSTNISSRSCFRCIGKWLPLSVIWAHLFDLLEYLATSFILSSDVGFSCVNSDVTLSSPWPSFLLLYYRSGLGGLLPWCVCFQTPRARSASECVCMYVPSV